MKKVMMIAAVVVMSVGFYAVDTANDEVTLYDVENSLATDGEDTEIGENRGSEA